MDKPTLKFKHSKKLGECLKRYRVLKDKLDKVQATLMPLAAEVGSLREHMIATFKKDELNGATGAMLSVVLTKTDHPSVEDWDAYWKFVKLKGNEDLVPRGVNKDAWKERVAAKKAVPGVKVFTSVGIRVTDLKGKQKQES